jgi:signal transduction histidine kinase
MKQGADDFLAKPFKPQELRLVVERVLKRVRTVQDMAVEKSRTRALVNAMTNGVLVVTPREEVALLNPALARLLEWEGREAAGRPMEEVLPCAEVLAALKAALEAGARGEAREDSEPVTCQITLGDPREPVHLQVLCEPFRDGRGHLVGAVAVFDDVTALRRLDELKSEFVSMVAHEIASPLSSVLGQLQTLGKEVAGELNDKQRHLTHRAASRVEGIINLSRDLLDLSKIEAGTLGEPAEVDLGAVIREAVDIVSAQAEEKGQTVEVEVEDDLRPIQAVPRAVQEVVLNLVSNAVKYTPEGGRVSVAARNAAGGVELAVSDTGFGIAPEDQDKVFQRFYRVKDAQTRHIVGTGLGLPIVKQVVEGHGGSLELASRPGRGSTFTVRLPPRPPAD